MLILKLPILTQTIPLTNTTPTILTFLLSHCGDTVYRRVFVILRLNTNILHFAFNPKHSILSRYKLS